MTSGVEGNRHRVSIVIPVRNEERFIGDCLEAVLRQETDFSHDILVIDSGSVDRTREIVSQYPSIRLITIDPREFGHGKTRNLGAQKTGGDHIVFLNGDAVPADKKWLDNLIKALEGDDSLAGVYSRHLPRDGCHLYMVRDLVKSMPSTSREISRSKALDFFLFSTVSAAIPRRVWQAHPFDENVSIAEDQNWGRTVIEQGYRIRYLPESRVVHSHNYTAGEMFNIKKRVGGVLKRFDNRLLNIFPGLVYIVGGLIVKLGADMVFILSRKCPLKKKILEVKAALVARIAGFAGKYAGWITS